MIVFYIEVKGLFHQVKWNRPLPPRGDAEKFVKAMGTRYVYKVLSESNGCEIIIDQEKRHYNRQELVEAYREFDK